MRRIIYIGIVFVMILNLMCFNTVSADTYADNSYVYNNSVQLITALNIMEIKSSFEEASNETVSRGEAVNAVMRSIVNDSGNTSSGKRKINLNEAPYADVSSGMWYAANVQFAKTKGIISDGNEFYPEKAILFNEFAKIVVCAAGYAPEAEKNGGFPIGYVSVGTSLGLFKNTSGLIDELSKADLTIILSNLLTCSPMVHKQYNTFSKYEILDDTNFLTYVFDVKKTTGCIIETSVCSITSNDYCHDGYVVVAPVDDVDGTLFNCGKINMDNFLGRVVDIYYSVTDEENVIMCAVSHYNDKDLTEISNDEFETFSSSTRTIEYTKRHSENLWETYENKCRVKIPADCNLLINGVFSTDITYAFDILEGKKLDLDSIRLIDNDRDGNIDMIDIRAYYTVFPKYINKQELTITDKYTSQAINLSKDNKDCTYKVYNSNMKKLDFGVIGTNMIVSVFAGIGPKKEDYTFITSQSKVRGIITEKEKNDDLCSVKVDGIEYISSKSLSDEIDKMIKVGEKYTLYLDYNGKIGGYKLDFETSGFDEYGLATSTSDAGKYFGIVTACGISNGLDKKISLKIFSTRGVTKVYELDRKCTYNNNDFDESSYSGITAAIIKKIVEYTLNSDGKITKIKSPQTQRDDNTLSYATGFDGSIQSLTFKENANVFFGKTSTAIGNKTVVINVPSDDYQGDLSRAYSIGVKSDFSNDKVYHVEAYYTGKEGVSADVLLKYSDSAQSLPLTTESFVVSSVKSVINSDGMEAKLIEGLQMNYEKSYMTASDNVIDIDGNVVQVAPGDIIQISVNSVGECEFVRVLFDYDSPDKYKKPGSYIDAGRIMKCCIYDKDDSVIQVVKNSFTIEESMLSHLDSTEIHSTGYARVCIFEKNKRAGSKPTLKKASAYDFVSYKDDPINYTHLVVVSNYGNPGAVMVIYKD